MLGDIYDFFQSILALRWLLVGGDGFLVESVEVCENWPKYYGYQKGDLCLNS